MSSSSVCRVCNEQGHSAKRCPGLHLDLNEGFYTGGSPGGDHDHDEERFINIYLHNLESLDYVDNFIVAIPLLINTSMNQCGFV
jgi:hypothetical protein